MCSDALGSVEFASLGVLVGTGCVGWYWVCWLVLGVLVGTGCVGWYWVCWLVLGVLVGTGCVVLVLGVLLCRLSCVC